MEFLAVISPRCFGEGWKNSAVGSLAFNLKYDVEGGLYHSGCYWGVLNMFKEILIQCHLFQLPKAPISPCWQKHRFSNSSTSYLDIPSFSAWCSGKNKSDFVTKTIFSLSLLLNLMPDSLLIQSLFCLFYLEVV